MSHDAPIHPRGQISCIRSTSFARRAVLLISLDFLTPSLRGSASGEQAIHFTAWRKMDCFPEPVIGRRFAPTRWLAMTAEATGLFDRLHRDLAHSRSVRHG
jgi:hypothetical protein